MLLKLNVIDPQVIELRAILKAEGFDPGNPASDLFDHLVEDQVHEFQDRHAGPDGAFLIPDGVIGPKTWWALQHPTQTIQTPDIVDLTIPKGLTPIRQRVLMIAASEYQVGVHEVPNGANRGDGVDKYLKGGAAQWCCAFVSWVYHEATGDWPFGSHELSTWRAWQYCINRLQSKKPDDSYTIIPGDFMLIQHKRNNVFTRTGHIAIVISVSEDGFSFNTIAGNEDNKVELGLRNRNQPGLVSFLNVYPDDEQPTAFKRGLVNRNLIASIKTT